MTDKSYFIIYGSQTGNSECIANRLFERCRDHELPAQIMNLNAAKEVNLRDVAHTVIVVCSTTGNGDCPENGDKWWRSIKLRSASKTLFENVPFIVLGLGDTNYDKFCHMGKSIDKRMAELGGQRLAPLCCADEVTGLEETVEAWTESTIRLLIEFHRNMIASANASTLESEQTAPIDEESAGVNIEINTNEQALEANVSVNDSGPKAVPEGITFIDSVAAMVGLGPTEWHSFLETMDPLGQTAGAVSGPPSITGVFNLDEPPEPTCSSSVEPTRSTSVGSVTSTSSGASASFSLAKVSSFPNLEEARRNRKSPITAPACETWCATNSFPSSVLGARWLTTDNDVEATNNSAWGSTRRVLELQLSLHGSGILYQPGDSIGVCCPNPRPLAAEIVARLRSLYENDSINFGSVLEPALFVGSKYHCDRQTTLEEFLVYRCDLMGVPKKAVVNKLATFCSDIKDKRSLLALASKGETGKHLWKMFLESQRLGVGELIYLFASCRPTMQQLIEVLIPMPPRYYSIASSPLIHPNSVTIAFSVVRYTCSIVPVTSSATSTEPVPSLIRRSGLCTSFLENLVSPIVDASGPSSAGIIASLPPVRIFHKATISFHLPGSVGHPLILIGPGTGVAPFVGFLEHRAQLERERVALVGDDDMCCGVWRGGFELEEHDLPSEANQVEEYIKSVCPGPIYMFYGCRGDSDYLFREELAEYLRTGTLSILDVAKSRIGPEKVYVTHKLLARGETIARLLLKDSAYLYICGDGNHMARDVGLAVKNILVEHGGLTTSQAEEMIADLKQRRRYVLDIWS